MQADETQNVRNRQNKSPCVRTCFSPAFATALALLLLPPPLPRFVSQMHVVAETSTVVGREAVIRTSMGDIRAKLFPDECPKVCRLALPPRRCRGQRLRAVSVPRLPCVYSLVDDWVTSV